MSLARSERVRLYVAGRLEGEDRETFEAALFEDETLLSEVEAEQALRTGFAGMPQAAVVKKKAKPAWAAPQRWLPLAASFVLGIGTAALWHAQSVVSKIQPNPEVVRLDTPRGPAGGPQTFVIAGDVTPVLIEVAIGLGFNQVFSLSVTRVNDGKTFSIEGLRADREGMLSAIVPADKLTDGTYTAVLRGVGGKPDLTPIEFGFRVERRK